MNINKISLNNFRCFENTEIEFNKQFTVIVGKNGVGKSTILDAVAIGLGSFLAGFDGVPSNSIAKDDVRYRTYEMGSVVDRQPQFPVEIECKGSIDDTNLTWKRTLNSENGRTTIVDARQIMKYADVLQQRVRKGDKNVILPVISYYGTGRLWAQKKQKHSVYQKQNISRISGYTDSLDAMSNEKLMLKWFERMTLIELQEMRKLPELDAVRNALKKCLNGILPDTNHNKNSEIIYDIKTHSIVITYIDENGEKQKHPIKELSDGYKNTLSMIADIAYRMAELNPQLLEHVVDKTPGIVLIDELDLHLHPSWQKRIIKDLRDIFPKVQFIVTTHAPSIIGSISHKNLIVLANNEVIYPLSTTYGRDINSVLREIMGVSVRQPEIIDKFTEFYQSIDREDYDKARKILEELESILGNEDPEITGANVTLQLESMQMEE